MSVGTNPGGEAPAAPAMDPALAGALNLQVADVRRQNLETQLRQVPTELAALERRITEENAAIEVQRRAFQELEVQRKDVDNRLKSAEAQVMKYKTQQVEVRKNDEYQALSHQIATAEAEVSTLETAELEQMMKIDEARAALNAAEAECRRRLADLDGEIAHVKKREAQCRADLASQEGAVENAAATVPAPWKRAYETAKARAKRAPYLVPIEDHRCGGCHLRVSNEVAEAARHGGKPVMCDNCGRVVYWSLP